MFANQHRAQQMFPLTKTTSPQQQVTCKPLPLVKLPPPPPHQEPHSQQPCTTVSVVVLTQLLTLMVGTYPTAVVSDQALIQLLAFQPSQSEALFHGTPVTSNLPQLPL